MSFVGIRFCTTTFGNKSYQSITSNFVEITYMKQNKYKLDIGTWMNFAYKRFFHSAKEFYIFIIAVKNHHYVIKNYNCHDHYYLF